MGTGASKSTEDGGSHGGEAREESLDQAGGQLYVSLKMENYKLKGELIPHVYGSVPLVGSWDASKALPMERESASMWELSFVVPPNHETLDFKFLLRPTCGNGPCIVEEGPNRVLTGGTLQGDARLAFFRLDSEELLESRVFIKADRVSPFDLAASWRAYQENLQPSTVRGIPDVSINSVRQVGPESGSSASLELDLEHYLVPAPTTSANSGQIYAANNTETPRSLRYAGVFSNAEGSGSVSHSGISADRPATIKEMEVVVPDPSKVYSGSGMSESKSVGTFSPLQKQDSYRGLFVDRGVGSPRLVKSASASTFTMDLKLDNETNNSMPAAAGAVAAAAIADQMLGPKEDRHLAIVLVGLPARGKTFTAAKLTRYLRWLGHDTKHFNVGKYRRLKQGTNQSADFFRADNPEGMEARNEVAALAMEDMISWMQEGGQVGIFDATNSMRERRNMLMKMAEGKCKIIFLETICNDRDIILRNIRLKIQQSPDYAEQPDFEAGLQDFKNRLANYEKVYEPVEEGSYIKMIDMVSGHGGQLQVNNISGYLPGRIVFFLVNTHLTPRPILLTRHGESRDNVRGRIGGDNVLSDKGEIYAKKLANFIEKRLKSERAASIWTSTLQRTILTASPIVGFPKIQWRALDEINAGVCDGMTYEEIRKNMPEEYDARKKDKLRYRYPRGESYLDVIQRLEPVIIELERQRAPVVVISHQAVLRALYAYFADRPLKEIPHIEMPLHTIIEIQMGVTGVQEKRYKLMD
ncbi:6-phosphofructo-2-kinase/fructose-2,6-bisphosphatase isoform X3 [Pistacia vera]|uniref:6-phosphofructo-2-kinase/fructose-2, 6-bisphosphatase isoform X3 n=1 Tax=Pistacia vera TaxID=55513 RepID=UPI00126398FC|nr:6-phosphofructo-2-kinase/fructose-2,6-bisphosphatase isoform X3 [Pistacia vera]